MSDVAALRDRVERQEEELEAAVRELAGAAQRSVGSAAWIRAHPWTCLLGASALGFAVARLLRSAR